MAKTKKESNNYTVKISKKIGIYKNKTTSSKKLGYYKKGETVTVKTESTDSSGNIWGKTIDGYFMLLNRTKNTVKDPDGGYNIDITTVSKDDSAIYTNYVKGQWDKTSMALSDLQKFLQEDVKGEGHTKYTMQLFGIPYQFLDSVDARVATVNESVGRKFLKDFILDGAVVTILPGKPTYLPGKADKASITEAFLSESPSGVSTFAEAVARGDITKLRLYDFQTSYVEYMRYVNVLCRTCAAFLELDKNEEEEMYNINGKYANFMTFDWKDYRWSGQQYQSVIGKAVNTGINNVATQTKNFAEKGGEFLDFITNGSASKLAKKIYNNTIGKVKELVEADKEKNPNPINTSDGTSKMSEEEETLIEQLGRKVHYVQFYTDPSSTGEQTSLSNTTQQSTFKGYLDQGTNAVREIQFLTNSGGVDNTTIEKLGSGALKGLTDLFDNTASKDSGLMGRLASFASGIVKGENVIMPDIYGGTSRSASYSVTIPLKCVYGNKYSYYMDLLVPLMHCIALAYPKATSANTYSSPFLVKAYQRGVFTCNLGLVTDISIDWDEVRNADGLSMGATVRLSITDLYPDIAMTPSDDAVTFINNSSLIEYLATVCGLSLIESQFSKKLDLIFNTVKNNVLEIPSNVISEATQKIDAALFSFTGL